LQQALALDPALELLVQSLDGICQTTASEERGEAPSAGGERTEVRVELVSRELAFRRPR
jgi:hypothetical protein